MQWILFLFLIRFLWFLKMTILSIILSINSVTNQCITFQFPFIKCLIYFKLNVLSNIGVYIEVFRNLRLGVKRNTNQVQVEAIYKLFEINGCTINLVSYVGRYILKRFLCALCILKINCLQLWQLYYETIQNNFQITRYLWA